MKSKGLLVAAATAAVLTVFSGLGQAFHPELGPRELVVPAGRIGDRLVYASYERSNGSEWALVDVVGHELVALKSTPTVDGSIQPALLIVTNRTVGAVAAGSPSLRLPSLTHVYVSLSERHVIRTDLRNPQTGLVFSFFNETVPPVESLAFQGQRLRHGDAWTEPLSTMISVPLVFLWGFTFPVLGALQPLPSYFFHLGWLDVPWSDEPTTIHVQVLRGPVLGGSASMELRQGFTIRRVDLEHGFASVHVVASTWFTATSAYPVATHLRARMTDIEGRNLEVSEVLVNLARFDRGTGPSIPWGSSPTPTDMERTPGKGMPGSGNRSQLPYPVDQALADVEQTPLPEFRLWKDKHPTAVVRRMELRRGEYDTEDRPSHHWDFLFSVPNGESFLVTTMRFAGLPIPLAKEHGERTIESWNQSSLPDAPITLAEAERRWVAWTGSTTPPDAVFWGEPGEIHVPRLCPFPHPPGPKPDFDLPVAHYLAIGRDSGGGCWRPGYGIDAELLFLDVSTGRLHPSYAANDLAQTELGALVAPEARIPESAGAPNAAVALQPFLPATTGLGLLLVGLFAILAALREIASRFAGTPAYSKVRKDRLFDDPLREALQQLLAHDPGLHVAEIARRLGRAEETVLYHLRTLERHGQVVGVEDGRNRRFFLPGRTPLAQREIVGALQHDGTRRVHDLIVDEPGRTCSDLSRLLGVTRAAVLWHLR